jgi:hypothetical protein
VTGALQQLNSLCTFWPYQHLDENWCYFTSFTRHYFVD